jgi:hypothetical protein
MARFPTRQKVLRVVDFMLGLRHPRVVVALRRGGYTEAIHREGQALLARVLAGRFDVGSLPGPSVLALLDEWENAWYPLAKHVLKLRFPEHHEKVFLNMNPSEGAALIGYMPELVERLEALPPEVRERLAERGLTDDVLARAHELIGMLTEFEPAEPQIDREADEAAVAALWLWYTDWSFTARREIRDRRLLRALGFRSGGGPDDDPSD